MTAPAQTAAPATTAAPRVFSLRWKLLIGFTLLFSIVFAVAFYWFYSFTSARTLKFIRNDLTNTLVAAAKGVNADELLSLYADGKPNAEGFSDDPRYARQIAWLDTVHKIEPRAWPYIYVKGSKPGEVVFVVDLYSRYDKSKAAHFRETYDPVTPYPVRGLADQAVNTVPYRDKWGSWISGYAPVKNAVGGNVAALGIDFSADYLYEVQDSIRNTTGIAFAITYAVLLLLVLLISGAFTGPIQRLTAAAERIADGEYDTDFSGLRQGRVRDEIGVLASVFQTMVGKVQEREQNLRREVQELRIEIDESKKNRQVNEIVESDFFRDLKSKARNMRARAHTDEDEPAASAASGDEPAT